ncbi:hypothetical protein JZ751_007499, partial [Albula glossodonta]
MKSCEWHQRSVRTLGLLHSVLLLVLLQSEALAAKKLRGSRAQPRRTLPSPQYRERAEATESFPLDFTAVEGNMDNFMAQVKNLAQSLYPCSAQKLDYDMKLHFLENTSVTCNDGTPAGQPRPVVGSRERGGVLTMAMKAKCTPDQRRSACAPALERQTIPVLRRDSQSDAALETQRDTDSCHTGRASSQRTMLLREAGTVQITYRLQDLYYMKESKGSKRWLIFLEGGWYCFDKDTCESRYDTMRRLMSSTKWPQTKTASEGHKGWRCLWAGRTGGVGLLTDTAKPNGKTSAPRLKDPAQAGLNFEEYTEVLRQGTGILSAQPEENPHWWNANMVFIPYCSSDVWSGASAKTDKSDYAFMGALIIQEVVKELLLKGLQNAKVLLLAGSSAGGTGVLLNVDRVAEQLEELGHTGIQVRGLSDSGWFLDNKQYRCTDCVDTISCAPTEAIKRGIKYWGGIVPERCRLAHEGEEWNCFFGYKVYPTLQSPVFVVQWLFDEAQLTVDNIHLTGQPVQEGQWRYIQNLGNELRSTLKDVPAMFAPACLSHEVITRNYWMDIQVKGTSLPRALQCWDRSLHDNSKNNKAPPKGCPVHLIDSCPWPHCNPTCPTIRDQYTGQEMNVIQFLLHMGFDLLSPPTGSFRPVPPLALDPPVPSSCCASPTLRMCSCGGLHRGHRRIPICPQEVQKRACCFSLEVPLQGAQAGHRFTVPMCESLWPISHEKLLHPLQPKPRFHHLPDPFTNKGLGHPLSLWPCPLPLDPPSPFGPVLSLWPLPSPFGPDLSLWPRPNPFALPSPFGPVLIHSPCPLPLALPSRFCPALSLLPRPLPLAPSSPFGPCPLHSAPTSPFGPVLIHSPLPSPFGPALSLWPHPLPLAPPSPFGPVLSLWPRPLPLALSSPFGPCPLHSALTSPFGPVLIHSPCPLPLALPSRFCPALSLWPRPLPLALSSPFGPCPLHSAPTSPFGPVLIHSPLPSPFGPALPPWPHPLPFAPPSPFGPALSLWPHPTPFGPVLSLWPHPTPFGPVLLPKHSSHSSPSHHFISNLIP